MSEIKFTPGPWLFSSYKSGTSVIVIDGKEFDVATVSYPNRDANANLIAAAPTMYEVLDWLDRRGGLGLEVHAVISTALAQARGEA